MRGNLSSGDVEVFRAQCGCGLGNCKTDQALADAEERGTGRWRSRSLERVLGRQLGIYDDGDGVKSMLMRRDGRG
jgi:hypothetical protein